MERAGLGGRIAQVRDLAFIGFLAAFVALGFRRPFLFVLAYTYIDLVSPQRLSYYLLNSMPLSMIVAALAIVSWAVFENKRGLRVPLQQWLILILLVYAYFTTIHADFPVDAKEKWDWAAPVLIWAFFLPLTLTTRLRIESYLLVMVLSASAIIIVGGIKTALSGGGYGMLVMLVDSNSGLFEGSTISTVAISMIPVILWLTKHGTIFPPDWRVRAFAYALIFACLLIPVGAATRTGVICIAMLAVLMLRQTKRRFVYMALVGLIAFVSIPMLPQDFTTRTATISTYKADESANTRLAVWAWTIDYANQNPLGGGFGAYRSNKIKYRTMGLETDGAVDVVQSVTIEDEARAFHSSYFEVLGEQGYPGLVLFLLIHGIGLLRMEIVRRRYKGNEGDLWISPLATALQSSHLIYLVGSAFIGIAYQPFVFMIVGVQIGLGSYLARRDRPKRSAEFRAVPAVRGAVGPAKT
jgi:probable O-glycosylation ligase (exosortase A-associated)